MKIKKTLLAAIALSVSVGAVSSSCSKQEIKPQDTEKQPLEINHEGQIGNDQQEKGPDLNFELIEGTRSPNISLPPWECPMCGMG